MEIWKRLNDGSYRSFENIFRGVRTIVPEENRHLPRLGLGLGLGLG